MGYFIDRQDGTFEIEYGGLACPFTGIDSSAPPPYIQPNALVDSNNFIIVDNALNTLQMQQFATYSSANNPVFVQASTLGVFALSNTFVTGSVLYVIKSYGGAILIYSIDGSTLYGSLTINNTPGPNTLTYVIVNQVCYFSFKYSTAIFQFDGTTLSILTSYLGAAYLSELNGRLIGAFITNGTNTDIEPNQIAWSAPQGNYSQWNPLDTNSLVTGAGFNNLTDVSDFITGIFTIGPTAYILRTQGITEMTPLNNGINPFDFNHLWASNRGMGAGFPLLIKQYGSVGVFVSETDVIMVGYDGIQAISGRSKTLIYNFIVNGIATINQNYTGSPGPIGYLGPLTINNSAEIYFVVTYFQINSNGTQTLNLIALNTTTKTAIKFDVDLVIDTNTTITNIVLDSISSYAASTFLASGLYLTVEQLNTTTNISNVTYYTLPNSPVANTDAYLTFPVEEIKIYRDITIDGFIVYAYSNLGGLTASISMGSTAGTLTTLASLTGGSWNYYRIFPDITTPVSTGIAPQLTITVTSNPNSDVLAIGKISVFGSYDTKQRPL